MSMKNIEPDLSQEDATPCLRSTGPAPGDTGETPSVSDVETAGETEEMTLEPETAHSAGAAEERRSPSVSTGKTESIEILDYEDDTERRAPGAPTESARASSGRSGPFSWSLDRIGDSAWIQPTGAERSDEIRPCVTGYDVLGILGEGGMGIVYKAHQVRLDRFVALKMIRAGTGARHQDLARFEAEARAVAAIEHANIVRIFEIGEHEGMPFCSLEYLPGGSLARKIDGKPRPVDEAASIVATLASAMEVAHKRGIVHRDLKPANVLIAADGTLKVSDFGLVKLLEEDSSQTRTGTILGTPSYMSPEQANGEIHKVGPAADQYALGAILYELLTGRPPFHGRSAFDTLDQVRNKGPVAPSQLQTKIPRDIETICLKCLEKDPGRRYADVTALVEDLRRFQAGEPFVARPISTPERVWRWCLRNRAVASLIATAASFLLLALAVSAIAAVTIYRKNRTLRDTNVALAKEKSLAETRQIIAEDAAQAANAQNRNAVETETEWINVMEHRLRYVPEVQEVREKMLSDATKNLDESIRAMTSLRAIIGWAPKDEENNWRTLARARHRLGEFHLSRNRFTEALEQFRLMDEIVESLAKASPDDPMAQMRLARSRRQIGFVTAQMLGDSPTGEKYLREALEINRACLAKKPGEDTFQRELANSLGQLASAELVLGHLESARELYREELQARTKFSAALARDESSRRELAGLYEKLGELSFRMKQPEEGRRNYGLAAEKRREFLAEHPDDWPAVHDLAQTYNNAGFVHYPQGREPAMAREYHRKALELIEKRVKVDPTNLETKTVLATTLYYDATCALESGDLAGAAAGYRRCLEIRKQLATEPKAKMSQIDLMVALARCGEHAEAARIAESLVATPPKDEYLYFQAACGYALSAEAAARDEALVRRYRSAALECLRQGKQRGWNDLETVESDPDLEPIRETPEFQALLAEFRKTAGKRP
jgi:serine/threonine protein kinase/tetratricopeptide (TPR) repeat protein